MHKVYFRNILLCDKAARAANPFRRFKGLMGRRELLEGEGLLIIPCNQVHTFRMRFPLDVLYLTRDMRIARIVTLEPGRVGPRVKEAASVLEVAAGSAAQWKIAEGDYLTME
ncbi:MAG: DUF192 domain-containing protein [Bacillota bacterium]